MCDYTVDGLEEWWSDIHEGDRVAYKGMYAGVVLAVGVGFYAVLTPTQRVAIYREGELRPYPPQSPPFGMPRIPP